MKRANLFILRWLQFPNRSIVNNFSTTSTNPHVSGHSPEKSMVKIPNLPGDVSVNLAKEHRDTESERSSGKSNHTDDSGLKSKSQRIITFLNSLH